MMSNISLHFLLSHFFPFVFSLFLQQFLLFLYFFFFLKGFLKASFQTPSTLQPFHQSPTVQISTSGGKNRRYLFTLQGSKVETL